MRVGFCGISCYSHRKLERILKEYLGLQVYTWYLLWDLKSKVSKYYLLWAAKGAVVTRIGVVGYIILYL